MLRRSHGNGEALRSFDDLAGTDDGYFKLLAREARHLREFIRCLKCIKNGGKSGVEDPVEHKYINLHGKNDINYGALADS